MNTETTQRFVRGGRGRANRPAWPVLPGVDRAVARHGTDGDAVLYDQLLTGFQSTYRDFEARLRDARLKGDTLTITREAHNLKSAAGYLGARTLAESARALEDTCGHALRVGRSYDEEDLNHALSRVLHHLSPLLEALAAMDNITDPAGVVPASPSEGDSAPGARDRDHPALAIALRELSVALTAGSVRAIALASRLRDLLGNSAHDEALERLEEAVQCYDFDRAGHALRDLAHTLDPDRAKAPPPLSRHPHPYSDATPRNPQPDHE